MTTEPNRPLELVGITGSLRAGSFNTLLLEACRSYLPEGVTLEIIGVGGMPLYETALDSDDPPATVTAFRRAIEGADAVLYSTPEYNFSVPGGLKNAIDWASRPAYRAALTNKPSGILSATGGPLGGVRAQGHLKQILSGTLSPVFPANEFLVGDAGKKFDEEGRLTDEKTRERLERYLTGFAAWIRSR
ncbi:MAG: NADPH-dependent FMN reductase [Candidatus Eisenbacteria bacterium]